MNILKAGVFSGGSRNSQISGRSGLSALSARPAVLAGMLLLCSAGVVPALSGDGVLDSSLNPSLFKISDEPAERGSVLELTLGGAVLLALQNNRGLVLERFRPDILSTYEDRRKAEFDPVLAAELSSSRQSRETEPDYGGEAFDISSGRTDLSAKISKFFPAGTDVAVGFSFDRDFSDLYSDRYSSRLGVTVIQSILQGRGSDFNLAGVRQAALDSLSSRYELRGFTENLVAEVEKTYWDYALAQRRIEIYRRSLELAELQLKETGDRIEAGVLAETERSAARAEKALRREALINSESAGEAVRLRLLRLLNPPGAAPWRHEIILKNPPLAPDAKLEDVGVHSSAALLMRPDINQARLGMQRGELEVVQTSNGLLPKMDFFIRMGKTGYSESFGGSVDDLSGGSYDVSAGIVFEFPLGNRQAVSSHKRAVLTRGQIEGALENLKQLAELDVRLAYIEVNRAFKQIEATADTLKFQEEKLRAETEKFRVGRSTAFLVAQAQRDLLDSQIAEVRAVVNYLNSLVEFFRLEGSLLQRRGISTGQDLNIFNDGGGG